MRHLRVLGLARRRGGSVNLTANRTTREAYDRWAAQYPPIPHNPLMRAEQLAMLAHWPAVRDLNVLDLACGSGRYTQILLDDGAAGVVAADFSAAMLERVSTPNRACVRVRADMMRLPFPDRCFDAVICGLAVGHASSILDWTRECARILRPQGRLLYSDFHPQAAQAGLTRSFTDDTGAKIVLKHVHHAVAAQTAALAQAGLRGEALEEVRVGFEFTERFADCEEFYRRWHGLPLLLIVRAVKS